MSMQRLRELRLYRKLEHDLNYRERINEKLREFSTSTTNNSLNSSQISHNFHNNFHNNINNNIPHQYKLNNNKKYQVIEQKNTEIERQNKILYNKIQQLNNNKSRLNIVNNFNNKSRINDQQFKIKKKLNNNNRTTRTEEYEDMNKINYQGNNRKKYNVSEQKQEQRNQNSRISFQRNEELMMMKSKKNNNKVKTEGITNFVNSPIYNNNEHNPQSASQIKSRIFFQHSPDQKKQTILFQGQAQIDNIKFKTKIVIRGQIYYLIGKNKHTQILLKMQLNEYKKFQKNVLKGNPGKIFQYLQINKGQIRFRTIQEDVEGEIREMNESEQHNEEEDKIKKKEKIYKNQKKLKKALMQRHNQNTQMMDVKQEMLRRIQHEKMKYYRQNSPNHKKFCTIPDNYYPNPTKFSQKIPISSSDNQIGSRKRQFSTILQKSPHNSSQLYRLRKQNNLNKSMKKKLFESPIYYHDNNNDENGKHNGNYEEENREMYEGRDGKHNHRLPYLA